MFSVASILLLAFSTVVRAQNVIPAGTLLQCTLDEPNFSSATADVGDPVVCYLKSVQQFGHILLPRGSYLQGHLSAEKNPGHFWGKGSLSLEFDRIGLPTGNIPVPSKLIAASGGFKTDRQGDVVGKGHATRDVVEWMLPPLWPWKMITLPARGPRPTFKKEERLTLRLMDDIVVPEAADLRSGLLPGWHYFEKPAEPLQNKPPSNNSSRPSFDSPTQYGTQNASARSEKIVYIALESNEVLGVTTYLIDHGRLNYLLTGGTRGSVALGEVDWKKTSEINASPAMTRNPDLRTY
jgi:hypothetical protein